MLAVGCSLERGRWAERLDSPPQVGTDTDTHTDTGALQLVSARGFWGTFFSAEMQSARLIGAFSLR